MHTREASQFQAWPWLTLGTATLWTVIQKLPHAKEGLRVEDTRCSATSLKLCPAAVLECLDRAGRFSHGRIQPLVDPVSKGVQFCESKKVPVAISPDPWLSLFEGDIAGASLSQETQSFGRAFLSAPSGQQRNHARIEKSTPTSVITNYPMSCNCRNKIKYSCYTLMGWIACNSCPQDLSNETVILVAEKHPFGKHASPPHEALQW